MSDLIKRYKYYNELYRLFNICVDAANYSYNRRRDPFEKIADVNSYLLEHQLDLLRQLSLETHAESNPDIMSRNYAVIFDLLLKYDPWRYTEEDMVDHPTLGEIARIPAKIYDKILPAHREATIGKRLEREEQLVRNALYKTEKYYREKITELELKLRAYERRFNQLNPIDQMIVGDLDEVQSDR